jgi:hypothetical protein
VIGTFKYSAFALNLIRSIRERHERKDVEIHLFSDNCVRNAELTYESINFHTVTHEEWPFSTLNRFKYILSKENLYRGSHLIYIDADALLRGDLTEILTSQEVNFVAHPGYWRPPRLIPFFHKRTSATWEDRPNQLSYVSPQKRGEYVCGGVWFGPREKTLKMCQIVQELHLKDLSMDQIPIWHDESMLNRWASLNPHGLLSPSLCYVDEYRHLNSIPRVIQAVTKSNRTATNGITDKNVE